MAAQLLVEERADGVCVLTLSNPGKKNAIDSVFLDELDATLKRLSQARCLVIRGAGEGVFSAGWDLSMLSTFEPGDRLPDDHLGVVLDGLAAHSAPSIAALDGPVFGAAFELAMACDFRVATSAAVMSMPPARLGVAYALKGLERFRQKVGDGTTRRLFLTADRLDAAEALELGVVDAVDTSAISWALAKAASVAELAPLALAGLKQGLALLGRGGGTEAERAEYQRLRLASFNSADAQEGRAAILEKRKPVFRGR
jgi:enoyl-CoA hydratase/carnithine racemase